MKRLILAAAVLAASTGLSAAAQEAAREEPKKEKKICRSEKVTGSLTRVNRICLTQAQWDELAARTRRGLDEMGRAAGGGTNSAWDPNKAPGAPGGPPVGGF
jgi:hypothetical protein